MARIAFDDRGPAALEIAGAKLSGKYNLAAFDFAAGTLLLTEAGAKRRALYLVQGAAALSRMILAARM